MSSDTQQILDNKNVNQKKTHYTFAYHEYARNKRLRGDDVMEDQDVIMVTNILVNNAELVTALNWSALFGRVTDRANVNRPK